MAIEEAEYKTSLSDVTGQNPASKFPGSSSTASGLEEGQDCSLQADAAIPVPGAEAHPGPIIGGPIAEAAVRYQAESCTLRNEEDLAHFDNRALPTTTKDIPSKGATNARSENAAPTLAPILGSAPGDEAVSDPTADTPPAPPPAISSWHLMTDRCQRGYQKASSAAHTMQPNPSTIVVSALISAASASRNFLLLSCHRLVLPLASF